MPPLPMLPIAIFILILGVGISFGLNTGKFDSMFLMVCILTEVGIDKVTVSIQLETLGLESLPGCSTGMRFGISEGKLYYRIRFSS